MEGMDLQMGNTKATPRSSPSHPGGRHYYHSRMQVLTSLVLRARTRHAAAVRPSEGPEVQMFLRPEATAWEQAWMGTAPGDPRPSTPPVLRPLEAAACTTYLLFWMR